MGQRADPWTLGGLARRFGLQLAAEPAGAADVAIRGMCSLENGKADGLAYADGRTRRRQALRTTAAAAVVVPPELADDAPVPALIDGQPRLAFARIAALFEYHPAADGVHSAAVVHAAATLGANVTVGAHAVIAAGCVIGAGTRVGANTVIGERVSVGENGLIGSNVSIGHDVRMGARVRIEANAVIGARGFGLVHNGRAWEPVPQLGGVVLGDDVEVGAGSCIDRGALDDTVIGDDVHIDNLVQIGHNSTVGAHTVIAGSAGVAGSCRIGSNCMIGGAVSIGDHVHIVDRVMITGASQVATDITEPGVWSSTLRTMPAGQWRRLLARFRRLGQTEQRLKRLERQD